MKDDLNIIFFDGECILCNRFVRYVIRCDTQRIFKFAPLQGETAKLKLNPEDVKNLNTVIVLINDEIFKTSDAIIQIFSRIKMHPSLTLILKVIPKTLRDTAYLVFSKSRYSIFGKNDNCEITNVDKTVLLP